MSVAGFVLAAGAGRRADGPKALRRDGAGGSWVQRALEVLYAGGCAPLAVVIGAAADDVRATLAAEPAATVLHNPDWAQGMGSSLRLALTWCEALDPRRVEAAIVMLVDTPGVTPAVVRAVRERCQGPHSLARASYGADAGPGHPVLLGRAHWQPIAQRCTGERGAAAYLESQAIELVDCRALGDGRDLDMPASGRRAHHDA